MGGKRPQNQAVIINKPLSEYSASNGSIVVFARLLFNAVVSLKQRINDTAQLLYATILIMAQHAAPQTRDVRLFRLTSSHKNLHESLKALFELLERHSPIWYEENYYDQASVALRESKGLLA